VGATTPEIWATDQGLPDRPGNQEVRPALFSGHGSDPARHPLWRDHFRKHQPPVRTTPVHQLLSERRLFARFVGTGEPPVGGPLPAGEKPAGRTHVERYTWPVKQRPPRLAQRKAASA
jgi:hypothetical protein